VIGLGVMMGRILEVSGAAEQIAFSFIRWLGRRREDWALAATGYLISIPIFADSAFVILYPISKALAKKGNRSIVTLGISLAGGLVVTHTLVPPTPGPLGAAGIYGVDVGAMMLLGMAIAVPCVVAIVLYARWLEQKNRSHNTDVTDATLQSAYDSYLKDRANHRLPNLSLSLCPIVVPIALIFIKALLGILFEGPMGNETQPFIISLSNFIGTPIIALCISTLLAVYLLVPYLDREKVSARLEEGLQSAGIILLVTGAGGALGAVVRESNAGTQLADQVTALPLSPIMIPFIIATIVRFIQGSGTVACVTTASICAPVLSQIPEINMLFAAQATVAGAFFFSYFNDSLFWVVNRMLGITEVRQQMMAWSIPTTIAWAVGGFCVALLNLLFGAQGSILDLVLPIVILFAIVVLTRRKTVFK
jgi:gluconate transporter